MADSRFPHIFINYRRDDTSGYSGRLYDALAARFGDDFVFMDIDALEPGEDFTQVVHRRVGSCDVLIALIGREWLTTSDREGRPRLQKPNDWVRIELQTGLTSARTTVIPALVHDAEMPSPDQLPETLRPLCDRNAIELSDARWNFDVQRLIRRLEELAGLPPPAATPPHVSRARPRWVIPAAAAGIVLAALLVAVLAVMGDGGGADRSGAAQYVGHVDAQLTQSAVDKGDLTVLIGQVKNGSKTRASSRDEIDRIIRQRTRLLADLPADPPAPFREAHRLLRSSIVASLADDRAVRSWIDAYLAGSPSRDRLWANVLRLSTDSTELKDDFRGEYNRVRRAQLGLTETFPDY